MIEKNKVQQNKIRARAALCFAIPYFFTLLTLIFSASALVVDRPEPIITVAFDEPTSFVNATLMDYSNKIIPVSLIGKNQENTTYRFRPAQLNDGDYVFKVYGNDILGNKGQVKEIMFTVKIGDFKISLISPRLGVSSFSPYNITIETNRRAICKYSFQASFDYISFDMNPFPATDQFLHRIDRYDKESTIYIKCNDTYKNEIHSAQYTLKIDAAPPAITSLYADPQQINQLTGGQRRTTIFAETDKPSFCTYTFNRTSYAFSEENFTNSSTYKASHQAFVSLPDDGKYTYYINCSSLADLYSGPKPLEIESNIFVGLIINFNEPKDGLATTKQEVNLNITTNKNTTCFFGNSSANISEQFVEENSRSHFENIGNFSDGKYTYYARCLVIADGTPNGEERIVSTTFTLDTTPPVMEEVNVSEPNLNITGKTCYTDQLFAIWRAADNESGIKAYNYSIFNKFTSATAKNWTYTTEKLARVYGLNLTDGESYIFSVKTQNKAGVLSNELSGNSITVDESLCPKAFSCKDNKKNSNETDIDCGGNQCSRCPEKKSCKANSDCATNICAGNICATELCANNVRDVGETDYDCGGDDCQKCDLNKICSKNSDCKSDYCENNKCIEPTCLDGKQNGKETDVDCGGGKCPECAEGQACMQSSDCKSNNCQISKAETIEAGAEKGICVISCSDNEKNGDETGVDCGGSCAKEGKLCTENQNCNQDSDCISGICKESICIEKAAEKVTEQPKAPPKSNLLRIILLILGAIILTAIIIYLIATRKKGKIMEKPVQKLAPSPRMVPTAPAVTKIPPEQLMEQERLKLFRERSDKKEKTRKELFRAFEEEKPKEKIEEKEETKELLAQQEWVPVSKLRELARKKPQKEISGKKGIEEKEKAERKEKPSAKIKKETAFEKLKELSGRKERELKEKTVKGKTEIRKPLEIFMQGKTKKPGKDVFDRLRQISGKESGKSIDSLIGKKIGKKDLAELLKELSSEVSKEKFVSIMKEILKYMMDRKKLSKVEATEVLDDIRKKGIITKKEMADVLFRLEEQETHS